MDYLKNKLVRLLYPSGATRRVLRGPLRNTRFLVQPGMGFTYAMGVDVFSWGFWQTRLEPGMIIYDVGANRGQMALYFARAVGPSGVVISLEPVPAAYASLTRNIELNGLKNVQTICAAAADHNGASAFESSEEYSTQGRLRRPGCAAEVPGSVTLEVRTVTLDALVDAAYPPPDVIKIDVEGGADALLRGGSEVFQKYAPKIYIELHNPEEQMSVRDQLMTRGYMVESLDGARIADPTRQWVTPLWCYV